MWQTIVPESVERNVMNNANVRYDPGFAALTEPDKKRYSPQFVTYLWGSGRNARQKKRREEAFAKFDLFSKGKFQSLNSKRHVDA